MAKTLVVVESPAKAKTIEKYLGGDYAVRASVGHIRDLSREFDGLGVDVEHEFEPHFVVTEDSEKNVAELQKALPDAPTGVILATDFDREGEAIAFDVAEVLGVSPRRARSGSRSPRSPETRSSRPSGTRARSTCGSSTRSGRAGSSTSSSGSGSRPILWRKVRPGCRPAASSRRALRLIVEREREIQAFVAGRVLEHPRPADARRRARRRSSPGVTETPEGKLAASPDKKGVLLGARARRRDPRRAAASAPSYRVLQGGAEGAQALARAALHHLDAAAGGRAQARVRRAQDHADGAAPLRGHRPAGRGVASGSSRTCGPTRSRSPTPRCARSRELGQDRLRRAGTRSPSPGATRRGPATPRRRTRRSDRRASMRTPAAGRRRRSSPDQLRLYTHDLAAHGRHPDGRGALQPGRRRHRRRSTATRATACEPPGRRSSSTGSSASTRRAATRGPTRTPRRLLPELAGRTRSSRCSRCVPEQHFTQPPPRYSEASLVKALEELGIGRPSTYASIISTIQDRKYVRLEDRRFRPEDVGEVVTDGLMEHFADIVDVNFTARLEEELDEIAEGENDRVQVLARVLRPVQGGARPGGGEVGALRRRDRRDVPAVRGRGPRSRRAGSSSGSGRFGFFIGCSRFADEDGGCKYIRNLDGSRTARARAARRALPRVRATAAAAVRSVRAVRRVQRLSGVPLHQEGPAEGARDQPARSAARDRSSRSGRGSASSTAATATRSATSA